MSAATAEPEGENLFLRLPRKLQHMVFELLLVNNKTDITFCVDADEDGALQAVEKLYAWDENVCREVVAYLTRPDVFRFVLHLHGEAAPRRPLLLALHRLSAGFRNGITRVYLPNYKIGPRQDDVFSDAVTSMHLIRIRIPSIAHLHLDVDVADFTISGEWDFKESRIFRVIEYLRFYPGVRSMNVTILWVGDPNDIFGPWRR